MRSRALYLDVVSVTEIARTPNFPLPYTLRDGWPVTEAETARKLEAVGSALHEILRQRLAISPRKDVLLYVHGVANTFDDALYTTAELWHYLGREFVPVAYTWPAGHGGLLRGYTYDRESSEFTVFHFKRFLAWLASLPEVEGIHIIAHSRGTGVAVTGLRELVIESRARGEEPLARYKLRNVVLAAPDIDLEVFMMRNETEAMSLAADRWTYYTSRSDGAIGLAQFLFSGLRIGRARYDSIGDLIRQRSDLIQSTLGNREVLVEYEGRFGGRHGHDYFRTNPAVASDLVLTVRYGRDPGAEHGRPLKHRGAIFWKIGDDYLQTLDAN